MPTAKKGVRKLSAKKVAAKKVAAKVGKKVAKKVSGKRGGRKVAGKKVAKKVKEVSPKKLVGDENVTVSWLAENQRMDKGDVTKYLDKLGLQPVVFGKAHFYPVAEAVKILASVRMAEDSSDRRNNAQAAKAETENEILQKTFRPISEFEFILANLARLCTQAVRGSKMNRKEQEDLINRFNAAVSTQVEEWKEEAQ